MKFSLFGIPVFDLQQRTIENPNTPLSSKNILKIFPMAEVASGVSVTPEKALAVTAVYAAVRVIAESIASLSLPVKQRLEGGGAKRAEQHPVYRLLHDQPNPFMSSFTFRETAAVHQLLWGNGYAEIERTTTTRKPVALWLMAPWRTKPRIENGAIVYDFQLDNGRTVTLSSENVLHFPALGFDGITGKSPILMAKEAVGLSLATEQYGAAFFGNGSRVSGFLTTEKPLGVDGRKRLKESWEEKHVGLKNSHRIAVLEDGLKWEQMGIPPEEAQFLETRKFQVAEIARIFRVPPHMIGDLEKATFSNIEQQALEFVQHTLRPWLVRWEHELNRKLFANKQFFAEFNVDSLLRGDSKSRAESLAIQRQNGVINADEWRALEGRNPLPNGKGQEYLNPLNMGAAGAKPPAKEPPADDNNARAVVLQGFERLLAEKLEHLGTKEYKAADRAMGKGVDLKGWTVGFYPEHTQRMQGAIETLLQSFAEIYPRTSTFLVDVPVWAGIIARQHCQDSAKLVDSGASAKELEAWIYQDSKQRSLGVLYDLAGKLDGG